jgi:hypothetical protein
MRINMKFPAAVAVGLALAVSSVALAGGATVTTTPIHPKVGKTVQMLVKGMKPNEKVKAHEVAPGPQTRNLYPRAGAGGSLLVKVKAQIKGKHTWTFTGRQSHRSATTKYYVR